MTTAGADPARPIPKVAGTGRHAGLVLAGLHPVLARPAGR